MKRKLLFIASLIIILITLTTVYFVRYSNKKVVQPQESGIVALMDKNGDNILTRDEFPTEMSKDFKSLDKDKDGKVTATDITSSKTPINVNSAFNKLDKNHDGLLSNNECPEKLKKEYKKIDTNKDGNLTTEEIKAIKTIVAPVDWFANIDKNNDGFITFTECPKNFRRDFCVADINNDRKITKTEFEIVLSMAKDSDLFGIYDLNADNVLTIEECPEKIKNNFTETDINNDGKLTKDEVIKREG